MKLVAEKWSRKILSPWIGPLIVPAAFLVIWLAVLAYPCRGETLGADVIWFWLSHSLLLACLSEPDTKPTSRHEPQFKGTFAHN